MPLSDRSRFLKSWVAPLCLVLLAAFIVAILVNRSGTPVMVAQPKSKEKAPPPNKADAPEPAPELEGGTAWFNCAAPLKIKDLKGKIILLDFWTLCCINCIHTLPDLHKLEKKYANELVVIGVHSAKFENERNSESIRKALLRYEIHHPVVNDADMKIWNAYQANSWPTLALIDPEGNLLGMTSGEGKLPLLEGAIEKLIKIHREKKTLDEKPIRFDTAKFRDKPTPLYFPGKVLGDEKGKRVFVADSTHHRIVILGEDGKKIDIAGTGIPGKTSGAFEKAQFDDPQGMALSPDGNTLYVADRRNHLLRSLDLKARTVKILAGTGEQDRGDRGEGGPALERGLNSPWALHLDGDRLFIAMAGHHQIWTLNLKDQMLEPYAGDGRENIKDGPLFAARFAQPSGLASDGKYLYVADPEVSAIRRVPMNGKGRVETLVGEGLFEFGDIDGLGKEARLQHAIGVAYYNGSVYVADTYNNKIKTINLKTGDVRTFLGGNLKKGEEPLFNEPAGLSVSGDKLYVADTNAHRVRIVDLATKAVTTLDIKGVEPVALPK
ncbi:MAG: redoxin domain-containing protein [Planctomycetes bacterium]|nr:redoxin domain-containing protein [Planctomycetota bacterium]